MSVISNDDAIAVEAVLAFSGIGLKPEVEGCSRRYYDDLIRRRSMFRLPKRAIMSENGVYELVTDRGIVKHLKSIRHGQSRRISFIAPQ
ncbi:MAG: hypothetical protein V1745_01180 [Patescibacteria group bacterium]